MRWTEETIRDPVAICRYIAVAMAREFREEAEDLLGTAWPHAKRIADRLDHSRPLAMRAKFIVRGTINARLTERRRRASDRKKMRKLPLEPLGAEGESIVPAVSREGSPAARAADREAIDRIMASDDGELLAHLVRGRCRARIADDMPVSRQGGYLRIDAARARAARMVAWGAPG